jgi:shikimate dehydrogenase
MKKFASIGHPIKQSKGAIIHGAGYSEFGIEANYELIDIEPKYLGDWIKQEARRFNGLSVTAPHKEAICQYLDQESEAAQKIGAINTVINDDGILVGTNTDCIGAFRAIAPVINPQGKRCLVLGAGGVSRAIIFALKNVGADIFILNRTFEKAEQLAKEFDVTALKSLEKVDPDQVDIIINATTVGMGEWKSVLDEHFWREKHVAFDAVYEPLETKFLHDASEVGAQIITGDQMYIHQAVEQFHLWHDIEIDPEIMFRAFFE